MTLLCQLVIRMHLYAQVVVSVDELHEQRELGTEMLPVLPSEEISAVSPHQFRQADTIRKFPVRLSVFEDRSRLRYSRDNPCLASPHLFL